MHCSLPAVHPQDFVREQDSTLRSLSLKDFAVVVFQNCPELRTYLVSTTTWSRQFVFVLLCTGHPLACSRCVRCQPVAASSYSLDSCSSTLNG
jgi:hypothetical protein